MTLDEFIERLQSFRTDETGVLEIRSHDHDTQWSMGFDHDALGETMLEIVNEREGRGSAKGDPFVLLTSLGYGSE